MPSFLRLRAQGDKKNLQAALERDCGEAQPQQLRKQCPFGDSEPSRALRLVADDPAALRHSALAPGGDCAQLSAHCSFEMTAASMTKEAKSPGLPAWLRVLLIGRKPRFTFIRVVVLVVTSFFVFWFLLLPIRIGGPSMLPTYRAGRVNFVNRLAYLRHEPRRGDVVSIRLSGDEYFIREMIGDLMKFQLNLNRLGRPSVMFMKRIVGLPGETVAFSEGQLLINGEVMPEPYVKSIWHWEMPPRTLGPDEFFVVGDNRSMPIDDHEHGAARRHRIVGKVLL